MDLARWKKGPKAIYKEVLTLSLTTKDLCTYISSRLGSTTVLDILYISGVSIAVLPPGMEGVFLFSKTAFAIIGAEVEAMEDRLEV